MKGIFLLIAIAGIMITAVSCDESKSDTSTISSSVFMNTQEFFNGYAAGLLTYSPETIASFYQVPLTVYSDQGIQHVGKMKEVETFWKQGVKPYERSGIKKSVPEILSEDRLSEKITACKVLWKNYDSSGKEIARETNFYILSKTNDGLKISGLIIMTQK